MRACTALSVRVGERVYAGHLAHGAACTVGTCDAVGQRVLRRQRTQPQAPRLEEQQGLQVLQPHH